MHLDTLEIHWDEIKNQSPPCCVQAPFSKRGVHMLAAWKMWVFGVYCFWVWDVGNPETFWKERQVLAEGSKRFLYLFWKKDE